MSAGVVAASYVATVPSPPFIGATGLAALSHSVTPHASAAVNDVALLFATSSINYNNVFTSPTAPAGWTLLQDALSQDNWNYASTKLLVWKKKLVSGDLGALVTVTDGVGQWYTTGMMVYRGSDVEASAKTSIVGAPDYRDRLAGPALTTLTNGAKVCHIVDHWSSGGGGGHDIAPDAATTQRGELAGDPRYSAMVMDEDAATAGVVPARTAINVRTNNLISCVSVAIAP